MNHVAANSNPKKAGKAIAASAACWLIFNQTQAPNATPPPPHYPPSTSSLIPTSTTSNNDSISHLDDKQSEGSTSSAGVSKASSFLGRSLISLNAPHKSSSLIGHKSLSSSSSIPFFNSNLSSNLPIPFSGRSYQQEFVELGQLGSGAYGSVFRAQNILDGNVYAIKKIKIPHVKIHQKLRELTSKVNSGAIILPSRGFSVEDTRRFLREAQIMASVSKHKNIVRYHQAWLEVMPNHRSKNTKKSTNRFKSLTLKNPLAITDVCENRNIVDIVNDMDDSLTRNETEDSWATGSWGSSLQAPTTDSSTLFQIQNETSQIHGELVKNELSDEFSDSQDDLTDTDEEDPAEDVSLVLFIQMELCSGANLYDWLRMPDREIETVTNRKLFQQLLEGLDHLHSRGYCHRDIKPANLMLVPKGSDHKLKVGDFGCCKKLDSIEHDFDLKEGASIQLASKHQEHTQGCGTYLYMAPELSTPCYDEKVDIFAAGIVLFELYHVFSTEMERSRMLTTLREKRLIDQKFATHYPVEASLVLKMTHPDPRERPSAFELLNSSKWGFSRFQDLEEDTTVELSEAQAMTDLYQSVANNDDDFKSLDSKDKQIKEQQELIESLRSQVAQLSLKQPNSQ